MFKKLYKTHDEAIAILGRKKRVAEMEREERELKLEIYKLYLPFHFTLKFNKVIVLISIAAIISYTAAAILLQRYTMMELSPTLTTAVYSFFGVELINLSRIKISEAKFTKCEPCNISENMAENGSDAAG